MRTVSGSKALKKFPKFQESLYFSVDLRQKNSFFIRFQRKEE